jgi:drug/metabolite transporter (DMT)-like permease
MREPTLKRLAFLCLLAGAVGIAFAPLFVRGSEVGPSATAFYRLLLALPFLAVWRAGSPARGPATTPSIGLGTLALPGLFFAGDLALWHWSIRLTSVANATLFLNLAPIFVTLGARILFQEPITARSVFGLVLALSGAMLVVGNTFARAQGKVLGDLLGVATAAFYAGYLLSVKHVRRTRSTWTVMLGTSLSACPVLLALATLSKEALMPISPMGWGTLLALALVSQVGGQGLIAYALAHLPASFSSVSLLVQPVVAACLAWLVLHEPLRPLQALGGIGVLAGIALVNRPGR